MAPSPSDPVRIIDVSQTALDQIVTAIATSVTFDVPAQNSAANDNWGDVIGNKTDTVAGDSLVSLVKSIVIGTALPDVTETVGTFSYDETNAAEQTLQTITILTRSDVNSIWIDMVNVTQDTTIRVYHQTDGVNYRQFQDNSWTAADDDNVLIEGFAAYRNIRITLQCAGGGAGNVNVPYAII